jgi:thiamine-phosphate pyrophosphorylase
VTLKPTKAPLICYVTERRALPPELGDANAEASLLKYIRNAATAGVDWIQLREKDLDAQSLCRLAGAAIAASRAANPAAAILINDRLDVAWAARTDGVHLGEASLPVALVARFKPLAGKPGLLLNFLPDFLIGASCHSLEAALRAEREGADYIFFGPVFATPSKASFGPPQGLPRLAEISRAVSIPVLAIGGVTAVNASSCLRAGAAGIAAIRLFQQEHDLKPLLAAIRSSSH